MATTLADLNAKSRAAFVAALGHVFEHSPWVVERAAEFRPFRSLAELHGRLMQAVEEASPAEQLALIRAHPDLASKVGLAEGLTAASKREQASAGLDRLSDEDHARFHALNAAYRERFGFPFIICVRKHDIHSILDAFARRLEASPDEEFRTALREISDIVRLRLAEIAIAETCP